MSLRARVLVVLIVVTAAVAVTVDAATYFALRPFLLERVDQQLNAAHRPVVSDLARSLLSDNGELVALAPGLYVELRTPEGTPYLKGAAPGQETPSLPARLALPQRRAVARNDDDSIFRTIAGEENDARFRVGTWRTSDDGYGLVLALPLDEVDSTLRRLLVVELLVTAAALAVGIALARTLVRVGLRPLDDISATAAAIAGGDLSQRVTRQEPTTEVGRLGAALNAMLGQIESAFAERRASEEHLRRFVADASHELRTPLTSIRAYAELFDRGADSRPEDLARVLRGIESEAARMGVLVDDLLLLARLDQGRPLEGVPVDLGAVAAEAVDAARAIEPERPIVLHVEGSIEVAGDQLRLRQLIDNLLANVRAHTPPGTRATVTIRTEGPMGVLVVEDEGPGLSTEDQVHAFDRFFRADPARARDAGGSGLGLAIVSAIAAAHGGRAGVRTSAAGGAEFQVWLPVLPPSTERRPATS